MYLSLILFGVTLSTIQSNAHVDKRLLLNDQDVILNRLNALEKTVNSQAIVMKQQADKIQQQSSEIQQLKLDSTKPGTTYVRWGRKQCPNNQTEIVYSGFAGGGYYSHSGSASEYVCLSPDPVFDKTSGSNYGEIYGSEFQTNFWASNSADEDVPCALCLTTHATTVMIPGTKLCNSGWHREYYGYLASGNYNDKASSSYVCVDIQPEYLISGVGDKNGKLFYNVLAKCGSLPCPPYIQDHPLMCVVCSR